MTPIRKIIVGLAVTTTLIALALPAHAQGFTFVKLVDSTEDGFDPFSFGCATINAGGQVAFRAGRLAPDGFNTVPGIYRVDADGTLTTIVEDQKRFGFIGRNPSMNDGGEVSFAARIDEGKKPDTESILRGSGKKLTTIASTADQFNFFGFDTSISNAGEVAFKVELDPEFDFDEGLFSGAGKNVIT
ncbi:MAG TPA: choice-of-anchor tandem repeat NxxGxxAF-containing protein, partial [Actinomycetota bacterium]|nr:choice-of-anchor tandem repeat NxxGxxAF-containing protein [Actinomycetota bacterium]